MQYQDAAYEVLSKGGYISLICAQIHAAQAHCCLCLGAAAYEQ